MRTAELRAVYAAPMRAMLDGLAEVLPDGSDYTRPQGGVFVWARLPERRSVRGLLRAALELGVFFMPGDLFFADAVDDATLRLSISNHTPETVDQGLGRLAAAVAGFSEHSGAGGR